MFKQAFEPFSSIVNKMDHKRKSAAAKAAAQLRKYLVPEYFIGEIHRLLLSQYRHRSWQQGMKGQCQNQYV